LHCYRKNRVVLQKQCAMKNLLTTALILTMAATCTTLTAQPRQEEYLGLPGDNLNLYAVMKLFQESETLEGFERNLNDENTRINNLDLNGDNFIDYIRVIDYVDGNDHNIVLRVAINKNENQDVAVFTVDRLRAGQVQIQLIGDEALYGKNYIIEPYYEGQYANETPNPGYSGNQSGSVTVVRTTQIEISAWPVIRFLFAPDYVAWHSSWYWGYWPTYWHPWRPFFWHYYYGYHYHWFDNYNRYYHRCDHYRYDRWNIYYSSNRRSYSPSVHHHINTGFYNTTYSHPDQRRDGEALYARTSHEQNRRMDQFRGQDNNGRQTSRPSDRREYAGTGTNHTSTGRDNGAAGRTVTNRRADQNTTTVRRYQDNGNHGIATPSNNRTAVSDQAPARRSAASTTTRSGGREMSAYNPAPERRAAASSNARPQRQMSQTSIDRPRSSAPAPRMSSSAPARRSEVHTQASRPAKSGESRKAAEPSKNDRRR
jgi:hypothetical protein